MIKVYISGRITGNPHYMQDFAHAEQVLDFSTINGQIFEIVNPTKIVPFDQNKSWRDYMREDIKALVDCDAIYMLSGWWRSKGARLERRIAINLGLEVIYEDW